MDDWGWEHLRPWLSRRVELPLAPLFCVIDGPTSGRPWAAPAVRIQFCRLAATQGCGADSLRTSCVTPAPLRWPARACR
jgi:hypothetical protein